MWVHKKFIHAILSIYPFYMRVSLRRGGGEGEQPGKWAPPQRIHIGPENCFSPTGNREHEN